MSEGRLVGIAGQPGSWCMGSLINWLKSGRMRPAIQGSKGESRIVSVVVPLVVFLALGPRIPPTLGPEPDMVKVTGGELGIELEGEPNEPEAELEWGLGGGITRTLSGGVNIPNRNLG